LQNALRLEASVGNDVSDVILPVLVGDVRLDLGATFAVEVQIDVRQALSAGIQKALEQKTS
jgi:hypothetical protein